MVQPAKQQSAHAEANVWYLAYGSNMNPKTLSLQRGVYPAESFPCRVPGYVINYHLLGLPYLEPAFASVEDASHPHSPVDCPELHGVAMRITPHELDLIRQSEAGQGYDDMGYQERAVEVVGYDGRKVKAITLVVVCDSEIRPGTHPSQRYVRLLAEGAKHHGLQQDYVKFLGQQEYFEATSTRQRIGQRIWLCMLLTVFFPFVMPYFVSRRFKVRLPRFLVVNLEFGRRLQWLVHDYFFSHLFGSGARGDMPVAESARLLRATSSNGMKAG
eukprot:jgi/Chlat1/4806/Chrsp31S08933